MEGKSRLSRLRSAERHGSRMNEENHVSLEDLLKLTRRRIGTILLFMLLGIVGAAGVLWVTPVTYTASSTAYVRVATPSGGASEANANVYYAASQLASQKVKAFVPVFTTETVAKGVIDKLGLSMAPETLARRVKATNSPNSLTIDVSATADSAEDARRIADEVVTQADRQISILEGEDSPVEVVLLSPSSLSSVEAHPSKPRYLTIGLVVGLLMGYGVAMARTLLDRRIRTAEDIENVFGVPLLGVVPKSSSVSRVEKSSLSDFRAEESLRKLRTNLRYANVDREMKILVVSSPMQGDGKSSVSSSLARVMALSEQDVILVDADLRCPTVKDTFEVSGAIGLSQLLAGTASLEEALVQTAIPGLKVLPGGDIPPNPSELLGSQRMAELLAYLAQDHVVIVDAPPVLPVTDAVILSKVADGLVMVVQAGRTTQDQLRMAMNNVVQGGGQVAGVVLNCATSSRLDRIRYGDSEYDYGYSSERYGSVPSAQPISVENRAVPVIPVAADGAHPESIDDFLERFAASESGNVQSRPPQHHHFRPVHVDSNPVHVDSNFEEF